MESKTDLQKCNKIIRRAIKDYKEAHNCYAADDLICMRKTLKEWKDILDLPENIGSLEYKDGVINDF